MFRKFFSYLPRYSHLVDALTPPVLVDQKKVEVKRGNGGSYRVDTVSSFLVGPIGFFSLTTCFHFFPQNEIVKRTVVCDRCVEAGIPCTGVEDFACDHCHMVKRKCVTTGGVRGTGEASTSGKKKRSGGKGLTVKVPPIAAVRHRGSWVLVLCSTRRFRRRRRRSRWRGSSRRGR
jgi:hypothetical protein